MGVIRSFVMAAIAGAADTPFFLRLPLPEADVFFQSASLSKLSPLRPPAALCCEPLGLRRPPPAAGTVPAERRFSPPTTEVYDD